MTTNADSAAFLARADRVIANARADERYELAWPAGPAGRAYTVPVMYLAIRELHRKARAKFTRCFVDIPLADVVDSVRADPDHAATLTAEALAEPLLIDPTGRLVLDGNHRVLRHLAAGHTHASAFRLHKPVAQFEVRADLRVALARWDTAARICGFQA